MLFLQYEKVMRGFHILEEYPIYSMELLTLGRLSRGSQSQGSFLLGWK